MTTVRPRFQKGPLIPGRILGHWVGSVAQVVDEVHVQFSLVARFGDPIVWQGNDPRGTFQHACNTRIRIPGGGGHRSFGQILDHGRVALVATVTITDNVAVTAHDLLTPGHGMGGKGGKHNEGLHILGFTIPIDTDRAHGQRLVVRGVDLGPIGLVTLKVHQKLEAMGRDLPVEALIVVELAVEVATVAGGIGLDVA